MFSIFISDQMQSIFVWKSDKPLSHSSTLTYYSGSYWFMEETEQGAKSYQYHQQMKLSPTSQHSNEIIVWNAEKMGSDWVGFQLLSTNKIPYHKVKEDSYAVLEYLGDWIRCIVFSPLEWNSQSLENEMTKIHQWMSYQPIHRNEYKDQSCMIRFNTSHTPSHHTALSRHNRHSYHSHPTSYQPRQHYASRSAPAYAPRHIAPPVL